jgi:tRNA-2-methylthio-N6-dimethylallyladenosine synthase
MSIPLIEDLNYLKEAHLQPEKEVKVTDEQTTTVLGGKKLYMESYGCQMNFADSEIVTSILQKEGFTTTSDSSKADLILLNTCAIRENAEQKIRNRLKQLNHQKKQNPGMLIGVLGCMAERLKSKLLEEERSVDMVVGPDAYRDLPRLVAEAEGGNKGVNVFLSREETYADITPVRLDSNGVSAFISIMRGCDNMCSFCVVPYTRGRERSRDPFSIVHEAKDLFEKGYREVTLLGQNVDSYKWSPETNTKIEIEKSDQVNQVVNFAQLLEMVALINPRLRVRFSTSHPKDITDEVLHTIAEYPNVCNYIHLPAQSGSTAVLERMNRTYTREWYLNKIEAIRRIVGEDTGISTDTITGFCGETPEDHLETLSLMNIVKYDFAYMFAYSERPGTPAAKKFLDDVPQSVKQERLKEVIQLQKEHSHYRNLKAVGKVHQVLVEGNSKKSEQYLSGRNSENKVIVFPKENYHKGDYIDVLVEDCTSATLIGRALSYSTFE